MKLQLPDLSKHRAKAGPGQSAGARILVLVTVAFVLGLGAGAYFYYRRVKAEAPPATDAAADLTLSAPTQSVLQRLDSPVEITFYSPSDPATLPPAWNDYVARVQQLLAAYERFGEGKIRLGHSDPAASTSAKTAAGAVGVLPFAGTNGAICYLGISIARGNQRETIPQLSPDWEAALESDLSRAIARVSASAAAPALPVAQASAGAAPIDTALSEELVRTIPDLDSRSYEDAAKILREAAMAEFTAAVREMQAKVQATQQNLATQAAKSDADQQAALKQLQQVQAEQSQKLSEITARLQAQLQALAKLKGIKRSAAN